MKSLTQEEQVEAVLKEKIVFVRFCVLCGKQDLRQPSKPGKVKKGRWVCTECQKYLAE